MGLYIGNRPVDIFSMIHKKNCVLAVDRLIDTTILTDKDIGYAYCLTTSYGSFHAGHIYKVVKNGNSFEYLDLNSDGAAISAIYNQDGTLRV